MSQNFDERNYQQWLPHGKPRNIYQAPSIIGYSKRGNAGGSFSIHTTLNALDSTLIRIAFGSCIVPTQFFLNTTTQTISFHSPIPIHASTSSPDCQKVPIYLVMIREESKELDILDSWFAGHFSYSKKKPTYFDDNSVDLKRTRMTDSPMLNYPHYRHDSGLQFSNPFMSLLPPRSPAPSELPTISSRPIQPIAPATTTPITPIVTTDVPDPFVNIPHHPIVQFENDLITMTQHWTDQENIRGRRLVQFYKTQIENTIWVRFNTYCTKAPDDPADFVISCIYWEQKEDYYLTSVDCVSLMEFLIGVMFTTQEKNRVRRTLQRFRPETVCKNLEYTQSFFRLIMGYAKPKPRKVEKDIKVYRWRDLKEILERIVHRFTPSHGSILSIITDVREEVEREEESGDDYNEEDEG
ncbi:hypothetical protein G6F56_010708 [Rhizopus delemar]|nr:hypothetical protein G6F56_010708 [Rhizopus delemar]